jgi:hypothetical protein
MQFKHNLASGDGITLSSQHSLDLLSSSVQTILSATLLTYYFWVGQVLKISQAYSYLQYIPE